MIKEQVIFKLNNLLLSSFENSEVIKEAVIKENDSMLSCVDETFKKEYKTIKKGERKQLSEKSEPALINALMYVSQNKFARGFDEFYRLLKENPNNLELKKSAALCLVNLKAYRHVVKHFVDDLKKHIENNEEIMSIVGGAYFGLPEHYADAIPIYEELVSIKPENANYNQRLAFLYERVYQDKKIEEQIFYAEKARELTDNKNQANVFLAKLYYRAGRKDECYKCVDEILSNNPTAEEIVSCCRFMMQDGRLEESYGMYRCRFETGNVTYPKLLFPEKRWDGEKDLSNSTVIVHYEQGFGDTVMFCRYIPEIAKRAKEVIFVVQKNLIPILKSSGFDRYCRILSHEADVNINIKLKDVNRSIMYSNGKGMGKIPHDFHIPLMDTPYLFKESPEKMEQACGYLTADREKIEEFREKYIQKNNKIKIGLAFHGTKQSILTYRDISIKKFMPILEMENVEFYSFQSDEYAKELEELSDDINIYDLGKEFKNFEDTACAMNCMDLMISTDNVVMNLAGALSIKTYCLFNIYPESRWYKTNGDDIGWYKSVRPFQVDTFNNWEPLMEQIKAQIKQDFNI